MRQFKKLFRLNREPVLYIRQKMELDTSFLNELLEFLRILKDIDLPAKFQTTRARLFGRVQAVAASAAGNYIHMKPGRPIEYDSGTDNSSAEYVAPNNETPNDDKPKSTPGDGPKQTTGNQNSFLFIYKKQRDSSASSTTTTSIAPLSPQTPQPPIRLGLEDSPPRPPPKTPVQPVVAAQKSIVTPKHEEAKKFTIEDYQEMNSYEAEKEAVYCGDLKKKERRFLFETLRVYWSALVGYHLLTYGNRNDPSPTLILSLRGCTCNPVLSSPRNAKKQSETVFEICMTDRTIQFTTSAAQTMDEWVAAIRRAEANSRDIVDEVRNETSSPDMIEEESSSEEAYEFVVPDIPEEVNRPKANPKPKLPLKPKNELNINQIPQRRLLPPTPIPAETYNEIEPVTEENYEIPTEDEIDQPEDIYDNIDQSKVQTSGKRETKEIYDDIEVMKRDASKISPESIETEATYYDVSMVNKNVGRITASENVTREFKMKMTPKPKEAEETYDDVSVVNKNVGRITASENVTREFKMKMSPKPREEAEETYDDVSVVKKNVGRTTASEDIAREFQMKITPEPIKIEETYDDVDVVKKEAENIGQNRRPGEVDKKLHVAESPKNLKNSPKKFNLSNIFRSKNNSPPKDESKKETVESSTASSGKKQPIAVETDCYVNNQTLKDHIYKNPPLPIPVHKADDDSDEKEAEESIYHDVAMKKTDEKEEEESIYHDVVTNVTDRSRETEVDNKTEKRRQGDMLVASLKVADDKNNSRPVPKPKPKPQRNVVRNLNESFEQEIYQNQSADENIENGLEHYQVPRGNPHAQSSVEDDDSEQTYDDVGIVAQKKREIEETKQKPSVANAKKKGVLVFPKLNDKCFMNKLNSKLAFGDRSSPDEKPMNRFNVGRKPKTQEDKPGPSGNCKIMASGSGIYDDCQMNGSFKSQVN